ncbi:hypothetical protein CLAFUW4_09957 [Fulvia fulva]|uniref:DUF4336 domain-containing protein n=1 Tax=Passalora fulva TaxID=5499 RepID=A0A9Q8UU89_PASFU|nr:uncharacterized protein CLAFUR5_12286 [Fulvia fulva]KAK4616063.1 hypothetical protein CLAFUR4_09961 [Fulvia fulva]KAK4616681.1 hypothetical protein CLAFUR0_09958 [Fulvia fulva]UJO22676.1 hypothetical protein CLAFUR5_12286 [Fulvia fulva]WPV19582.1 hypothetical protein CLAFUW4_09957 [Fulvia fulva]WPV34633.1 hypothetical protein CLAFUW7_09958 [Fulvia fulva]
MSELGVIIRDLDSYITTFTTPFYRFAPFGYRQFCAVGNRATCIRLSNGKVLLLNPIQLSTQIEDKLTSLGGVDYIASDLGHHLYITPYLTRWPTAKTIGVPGLASKRKDISWDFIYSPSPQTLTPEAAFNFSEDMETVLFTGFITHATAWHHKPTKTLIQSDLLMNLLATEQYHPTSSQAGLFSRLFAERAHPWSIWFRRLIYYIASVDYKSMRRDAKRVAEWEIARVVPCHGDVFEERCEEAWKSVYQWFLEGPAESGMLWTVKEPFMRAMRWVFLL